MPMAATCGLLLATVFALAALAKLRNLSAFEAVLRSLIPASLVWLSSRAVPAIELALALLLLAGVYTQLACSFAFLLLAFFGVILLHMWNKRLGGCGCFGESADSPNLLVALTRNALLMLVNLPLSLIGGIAAIAVTSGVVRIASLVGFVTLFGIATRNVILMVRQN